MIYLIALFINEIRNRYILGFFFSVANCTTKNIVYLFVYFSFYTHFSIFQGRYLEIKFQCCILSLWPSIYWNFPCLPCSLQPRKITGGGKLISPRQVGFLWLSKMNLVFLVWIFVIIFIYLFFMHQFGARSNIGVCGVYYQLYTYAFVQMLGNNRGMNRLLVILLGKETWIYINKISLLIPYLSSLFFRGKFIYFKRHKS